MKQAARKDANQTEIVEALRGVGASVAVTHRLGDGFVDLVVGYRGRNYMLEVKDGAKPLSKRQLTPDEAKFHDAWRGQISIVLCSDDALRSIGAIR